MNLLFTSVFHFSLQLLTCLPPHSKVHKVLGTLNLPQTDIFGQFSLNPWSMWRSRREWLPCISRKMILETSGIALHVCVPA
ncbi:hypothetical protein EDC04DRAFT_2879234, partial [Pisolithus marmoratus]